MMFVQLPSIVDNNCINKLNITFTSDKQCPYMSYSLNHYLNEIKNRISLNEQDWHAVKKYTNPFEYIHSNNAKASICKYKPISRAFFKMIEMIHEFHLLPDGTNPRELEPMQMFGLAEGPGGFIEAVATTRECANDKYYGMTIEDPVDDSVPGWKKTQHFLRTNPNVELEKGIDGTGNLLDVNNFLYVARKYQNKMDLVSGDGGFDFSDNFGGQEQNMVQLLFAQIAFALALQKPGGNFVLKMFDCFLKPTTELLYLLSSAYDKVYICKPCTSRCANSERYIVCTGYKTPVPIANLECALIQICNINNAKLSVKRIFEDVHIPMHYYNKIEECNCIIGQLQLENIGETLSLIESKYKTNKINNYLRMNTQKCIQWCIKNKMEYNVNANVYENNIFKPMKEPKVQNLTADGHSILRKEPNMKIHAFKLSEYESSI